MNSNDSDCLFCKIIAGEIPSNKVYENKNVLAFVDIQPQCDTHILVIPKKHMRNVNEVAQTDSQVFAQLFEAASEITREQGLSESGYRTVFNTGEHGCQSVFHLHLHILGGQQLGGSMVGKLN